MQGNILGKSVGDWAPGTCLSTVAPTVRSVLLLGDIWITICTCISLRKKNETHMHWAIEYHQSQGYIRKRINLCYSKKKKNNLHKGNQKKQNDFCFWPFSAGLRDCVHVCAQASCPLKCRGRDTLASIDFLQFEQVIKETLNGCTINHMSGHQSSSLRKCSSPQTLICFQCRCLSL